MTGVRISGLTAQADNPADDDLLILGNKKATKTQLLDHLSKELNTYSLSEFGDIDTTGIIDGDYLVHDGTSLSPTAFEPTGSITANASADVTAGAPVIGESAGTVSEVTGVAKFSAMGGSYIYRVCKTNTANVYLIMGSTSSGIDVRTVEFVNGVYYLRNSIQVVTGTFSDYKLFQSVYSGYYYLVGINGSNNSTLCIRVIEVVGTSLTYKFGQDVTTGVTACDAAQCYVNTNQYGIMVVYSKANTLYSYGFAYTGSTSNLYGPYIVATVASSLLSIACWSSEGTSYVYAATVDFSRNAKLYRLLLQGGSFTNESSVDLLGAGYHQYEYETLAVAYEPSTAAVVVFNAYTNGNASFQFYDYGSSLGLLLGAQTIVQPVANMRFARMQYYNPYTALYCHFGSTSAADLIQYTFDTGGNINTTTSIGYISGVNSVVGVDFDIGYPYNSTTFVVTHGNIFEYNVNSYTNNTSMIGVAKNSAATGEAVEVAVAPAIVELANFTGSVYANSQVYVKADGRISVTSSPEASDVYLGRGIAYPNKVLLK